MWHKGLNRYSNSVGKIIFGNKNETDTGNKNIFHTFYFVTESFGKVPNIFATDLQVIIMVLSNETITRGWNRPGNQER